MASTAATLAAERSRGVVKTFPRGESREAELREWQRLARRKFRTWEAVVLLSDWLAARTLGDEAGFSLKTLPNLRPADTYEKAAARLAASLAPMAHAARVQLVATLSGGGHLELAAIVPGYNWAEQGTLEGFPLKPAPELRAAVLKLGAKVYARALREREAERPKKKTTRAKP